MAKKQFKAESKRLLDLMIHSIYTHKEIFLREVISNASDAVDKLCYQVLSSADAAISREDFFIEIILDDDTRSLTIRDNGIGMTREELEKNLGTIAKSGSNQFKQELPAQEHADATLPDIIGQFGVGFYSAFMVSDKVTVLSRAYGAEEAWKWESSGTDGYTIAACEKADYGTDVILQIKEDSEDENYSRFLQEYEIVSLVKKYSDYIRYPIRMERTKYRPAPDAPEGAESEEYAEMETLNSMVPIWQRTKSETTQADYNAFYKDKFSDFEDPLMALHVDAEGIVSYKALLFVPAKAPYDYFTKEYRRGLQLYSSGVLIMDHCEDLLPEHFRFVRGVVDSPDLSLNISRELLQHDRQLKTIAANLEKKIRNELLKMMKNDREKYVAFYGQFGLQLKYGALADFGSKKEQLQDLLLFHSSSENALTSLAEYLTRMQPEQADIYYATGDSLAKILALPQAERVREKGYEMLCFTDEVDEFLAQIIRAYDEKPLKSVNSDDLDLEDAAEKEKVKQQQEQNADLLAFVKETLGDAVKEVKISQKLRSQPVCLSADGPLSFEMERYFNAVQPDSAAKAERVLELNAGHPIFEKLQLLHDSDPDGAARYAKILYHQAELLAGLPLENPAEYSGLVFELMK